MLIGLGRRQKHAGAEDAVDMLLACHERIRSFTALAAKLARSPGAPAAEVADAAARVHRYFTVALPLHEADEDRSLRPRLEAARLAPAVIDAAFAMTEQHRVIDEEVATLVALCERLVREPSAIASVAPDLGRSAGRLEMLFEMHLELEERTIFPAIRGGLPPEARASLLAEMRERRGLATAD
ncbi:MAG TPA: hemerythrin domain-containing protein [Planctomycetota bacterium]|nr:hemerythrin domain-containing protein [Planctomycetota bacterium]